MNVTIQLLMILGLILSAPSGIAAEKVKVASIFAKTGAASVGSMTTIEGVRLAIKELNRQGGLLGRQVKIIEYDNHSTALHSKQAAEMAVKEGVIAVFGANWSSHSLSMAPVIQKAGIPMISPFSTNPDVTRVGGYIFRVCFIDSFQGRIMQLLSKNEAASTDTSAEVISDMLRRRLARAAAVGYRLDKFLDLG